MKNILLGIFLLTSTLNFATDTIAVKSEINSVTVFLSGAQVERTASTTLKRGTSQLRFSGMTPDLVKKSIQVQGQGNFTILSVAHQINYLDEQKNRAEVESIQEKIKELSKRIALQEQLAGALQEEENMLLANKSIGGQNTGLTAAELESTLNLFRSRLKDIRLKRFAIKEDITKTGLERGTLNNQLSELRVKKNKATSEILVSVQANAGIGATFRLAYFVNNASWTPIYDIRVKDVNQPVSLSYKANVRQNTGVDWNNVPLTVSSANPNAGGEKPDISTWYLSFYNAYTKGYRYGAYDKERAYAEAKEEASRLEAAKAKAEEERAYKKMAEKAYRPVVKQTVQQTSVEFSITTPYTIPSDGKDYVVDMIKHSLKADYEYYCAPRYDTDAFLTAKVTGWEDLNLLAGDVNLFFEGKYLGESYLNTNVTNDTLDLSLGRDQNVIVTREKNKEFNSKKLLATKQKEERAWEIFVKNKKSQAISIVIEDQYPLSRTNEIVIEQIEHPGATLDKDTGVLTWKLDLPGKANRELGFKYEVRYPKGKEIKIE